MNAATIVAADVAVVTVVVTVVNVAVRVRRTRPAAAMVSTSAQVAEAADHLAEVMLSQWQVQAKTQGIVTPAPAVIHWRWGSPDVAVEAKEVRKQPLPGTTPRAMSGPADDGSTGLLESGVVARLHDEVYARLPHGRLILLGGPGAGKTGAMILLLLAALDHRRAVPEGQRGDVPVPVWLTMGGWNPTTTRFLEWAGSTIIRDHPYLGAGDYGPSAVTELLRGGYVALFLDGLDEMPPGARGSALKLLDNDTANLRTVLTSRPEEYRHAMAEGYLPNTAVVEIQPVEPDAATDYLIRGQVGHQRQRWEQVGSYLQGHPDSVATRALNDPLALSMARSTYQNLNPTELIDPDRFTTVAQLREHLLDGIMITAWPDERQRAHAIKWLAWIAQHMETSRDLAWWDIPSFIPVLQLRLAVGLGIGLGGGLGVGLLIEREHGLLVGLAAGLLALAVGLLAEIIFSFESLFPIEPKMLKPRWPRSRDLRSTLEDVLAFGLVFLLVCGLGGGAVGVVLVGFAHGFGIWAVLWLVGVLAFGLWGAVTVGHRTELGGDWSTGAIAGALAYGVGFGLPVALLVALPLGLAFGGLSGVISVLKGVLLYVLWGGLVGTAFGLGFGLVLTLVDAWTAPLASSIAATAHATYRNVRTSSVAFGIVEVLLVVLLVGLESEFARSLGFLLVTSLVTILLGAILGGLASGLRFKQVVLVKLTEFTLGLTGQGRAHFLRILEDARHLGVLRQAGAVYQFRHAELQDHLAKLHH